MFLLFFFISSLLANSPLAPSITLIRSSLLSETPLLIKFNRDNELMILYPTKLVVENVQTGVTRTKELTKHIKQPYLDEIKDYYVMVDEKLFSYAVGKNFSTEYSHPIVTETAKMMYGPSWQTQTFDGRILNATHVSRKIEVSDPLSNKPLATIPINEEFYPHFCEVNGDELYVPTKTSILKLNRNSKERQRIKTTASLAVSPHLICKPNLFLVQASPKGFQFFKDPTSMISEVPCEQAILWAFNESQSSFSTVCKDGVIKVFSDKGEVLGVHKHETELVDWLVFLSPKIIAYVNQTQIVILDNQAKEIASFDIFSERRGKKRVFGTKSRNGYFVINLNNEKLYYLKLNFP